MTEQLLSLGRKRAPDSVPALSVLNVVAGMRGMVSHSLGDRIDLHEHFCERPAWISITASHLEQILLNLLLNARDAIEGTGALRSPCA